MIKRMLKRKVCRGVQICEGGVHIRGGSKSAVTPESKWKGSRSLKGVDRLVRLLSFACAFKSSDLKTWLLLRNVLMTFLYDVIIWVSFLSFPCHFPVISLSVFLRFGKAGRDCITKGNIFMCARYFLIFQVHTVSPAEDNSRDTVFKTLFSVSSILSSIFENLYVFY